MAETNNIQQEIMFSPSALLNIFNNALSNEATRRSFLIKGRYSAGKNIAYNGYYYDQIKDENADSAMTLIVPALLRNQLQPDQTIECHAYLTKKVNLAGGRIDLQVNLVDILSQKRTELSEDALQAIDLLQQKAQAGYKDLDSFLKQCIIDARKVKITILVGKTAIIDSDIKHQLKEAIGFYEFRFVSVSLASENELIQAMKTHAPHTDILCISRGGGENIAFFNKPGIAAAALTLKTFFVTAIGHKDDITLLQKIADKSFITPTALGQYFNEIYNNTIEELQDSKAKLAEQITVQLKANYDKQIQNLNETVKANTLLYEKYKQENSIIHNKEMALLRAQQENANRQHQQELQQLQKLAEERERMFEQWKTSQQQPQPANNSLVWVMAVAVLILIFLLARTCN